MTDRIDELEIQLAHQAKMLEEMSEELHQQQQDITRLTRHVRLLMEASVAQDEDAPAANQRPPHW